MSAQNRILLRGDYSALTWEYSGDLRDRKIIFVVKAKRELSAVRVIERKNTNAGGSNSQLKVDYTSSINISTITVYLTPLLTAYLTAKDYYYDITSESPTDSNDHITIFHGKFILQHDIQSPYDGATVPVIDTSLIRHVYPGQSVADVIASFSDEASDKVYSILIYNGATMGDNFVNRPYINYQWMANSGVGWSFQSADIKGMNLANQDFTNADFQNCDCGNVVWTGAIVDGANFTGANMSVAKDEFKNAVGHFDPVTTIWTDNNPIGGI